MTRPLAAGQDDFVRRLSHASSPTTPLDCAPLPVPGSSVYRLTGHGSTPVLKRGPVQSEVWILRVPEASAYPRLDLSVLDEAERARLATLRQPESRVRYAYAHLALRAVLARHTGAAPRALRFGRRPCPCCGGPHGRPVLQGRLGAPEFSLSHRSDLVLIGTADETIGVDVEPEPSEETVAAVLPLLHPAERARIESAQAAARRAEFAVLWARKEAYLKGLGTGLGRDLAADDVTGDLPGWTVTDLSVGPGAAAAVATAAGGGAPDPGGVRLWHELPGTVYQEGSTSPVS